jgi:uncharacterized protein YuzE
MKNKNIKIKYDNESDILNWEVSKSAKIDYASEMGNIIVHFTKNNIPVLVEILEASKFLKENIKSFRFTSKDLKKMVA